jgi:hypothetical protein
MKNDKILVTKSKERFETICGLQHMQSFLHLIRTTMKGLGYFTVVPSKWLDLWRLTVFRVSCFPMS